MSAATADTLTRLAQELTAEGGLLAAALRPHGPLISVTDPELGRLTAAGPRAAAAPERYALVIEAVREAHLLHAGTARVLDAEDRDLAILAGDRLYALGLALLAELGDLPAVRELADLIALCALAGATRDHELADAAWLAGASAVGYGTTPQLEAAKISARAGYSAAPGLLIEAATAARATASETPRATT